MLINPERQARKELCKELNITNKRFKKQNKKNRLSGNGFYAYNIQRDKYELIRQN